MNQKNLLRTVILSRKIQRANNVCKVTQKLYILLLKKVNFEHHLLHIICNCFRNHCLHMVLRDPGRNSFFFLQKGLIDLTEYPLIQECLVCSITLTSSKVFFWEKKSRISSTWLLCIVFVWMNQKMGPTFNIFLSPKDLAQTSTVIGWKN